MSGRLVPVLLLVLLFLLVLAAMVLGWRRRAARQSDLPELPLPIAGGKALSWTADPVSGTGVYVVTTLAGQPLERVTARGLGVRTRAQITDADDAGRPVLSISRGADSPAGPWFLIPWADVLSVHTAPGMVGKWVGGDGLLVIRWRLGDTELDTGFRLEDPADQDRLLALGAERRGRAPETGAPAASPSAPSPSAASPSAPTPSAASPASPSAPALPATDPQPRKELP